MKKSDIKIRVDLRMGLFRLNFRTRIPREYHVRFRVGLDNRRVPVADWYFVVLKKAKDETAWISVVLDFSALLFAQLNPPCQH